MPSESSRGFTRILVNYSRLIITLALGIAVVPLAINWLGDEAFGIISLLGANIGLAAIFRQIVEMSLVRELGSAYHKDDASFKKSYATICAISLASAILSIATFSIVFALIPLFKIPEEFVNPARWFVFGQGLFTATIVLLSPMLNMYLVKERFIGYSSWLIGVRASNLLSVLILGYVIVIDDPALGLTLHGITGSVLAILCMLIAAVIIIFKDRRLMFKLKGTDKETRQQVFSTFGWNSGVQIAMNLHEQLPPILLNLFFGSLANASWGIGFRFVAYIRMVTTGVQFGSDAVSARLSSGTDTEQSRLQLQRFITIQTKLTTMVALPAAVGIFVYARPIFELWVGKQIKDYQGVMPHAVMFARILSFAILARAISDTWLIVLYGAGFVHRYAKLVIIGGIIAPLGSLILLFVLPPDIAIYAPPMMFTIVFATFHLIGIPIITARCLHVSAPSLFGGLLRPFIAVTLAITPALGWLFYKDQFVGMGFTQPITKETAQLINPTVILTSIAIMVVIYTFTAAFVILDTSDRKRIFRVLAPITSRLLKAKK
tara:strand:+ start:5604 stop:7244 length:1641 start_codon:yes stop_codon:yes gene_type:complete